ncbi:ATP-grasp domain-containing protein [Actinokineospora inagensis]|uniref:ATP-grasp domain-containing protein n=1 Tax=Actinokineospora inagensis TaxID=103730 RepID=UPI000420D71F|nr:ATP-grasp domain-containing protein [Actinokineospora inagensis]
MQDRTGTSGAAAEAYYVDVALPGLESFGEVEIRCGLLRDMGLRSLVLARPEMVERYTGKADLVVACADVYSTDAVTEVLTPYRGKLANWVTLNDLVWHMQLGVSDRLGITFPGKRGQLNCRIKPLLREVLADTLPTRARVINRDDLSRALVTELGADLGYPFVVKPIWGSGGSYVEFVEDAETGYDLISTVFTQLAEDSNIHTYGTDDGRLWDPRTQLLVEEYVTGRELSLEAFVQHGELTSLLTQEKYFWDSDGAYRFETANLCPTPFLTEAEHATIHTVMQDAITRLGVDDTFVHIEFKWDGDRVHMIELNPRLGGGAVPKTLDNWFGIDTRQLRFTLMVGDPMPAHFHGRDGFTLGVFVNAHQSGTFTELDGLSWVHAQPEFSFEQKYLQEGQHIPPRNGSKANRVHWLYCYDAFYDCTDITQIDRLYTETRNRVHLKFADAH